MSCCSANGGEQLPTPNTATLDSPEQRTQERIMADKVTKALKLIKPIVHVGFVPLIIYIAMKQEPELTLWQVIFPLASAAEPQPQLQ